MFDSKNKFHYIFAIGIILVVSYIGNSFKQTLESPNNDDYKLIQEYLLNESPLYGYNKPKLWIHTKYELNARKWKSFQSRGSTDLNQPYIHLCIKTIINHCGDDFNICLIDDETFSKLIPSWDINLNTLAEPIKSHVRELGMAQLIYIYGGMCVPNSFICSKNLKELYDDGVSNNTPFICENVNRSCYLQKQKHQLLFVPDPFLMGANKNDECMLNYVEYLKQRNSYPHFNSEVEFLGESSQYFIECINKQAICLIGGEFIGVKSMDRKPILLEDLMEEDYLSLYPNNYGLYIPQDELLRRNKYNWFAVLSSKEVLKTNTYISKVFISSMVETNTDYQKKHTGNEIQSILSI